MGHPTPASPQDVERYLREVDPRFQPLLRGLRTTIRRAAPDADEVISYRMPAFRQDGILVYYGAFSDHCSLFPGSVVTLDRFRERLQGFTSAKGTIQFTPERPLSPRIVMELVRARLRENADRARERARRP